MNRQDSNKAGGQEIKSRIRSIGKQSGETVESVLKTKRKAAVGRICRKGKF